MIDWAKRTVRQEKVLWFFMPPPLGAGGILFSGCPSARPSEAWNTIFWPVHGSVGPPDQPWLLTACPSVCPSVHPERFPGICRRTHGRNGLKFCTLMYLDHLQNWLVYGHVLLIFLILALFWLSETGQIWGFQAFWSWSVDFLCLELEILRYFVERGGGEV